MAKVTKRAKVVDGSVPIIESDEAVRAISGYDEFEIDIEAVLRQELPKFFDSIEATPLTPEHVQALPDKTKGAYMLFYGDDLIPVYAGKTDSDHGFRDRLKRHAWTVQGRKNLDPADMRFKAVRIMVFAVLDVEAILIKYMKKEVPNALSWNNSGFGSNDPGKERDTQKPAKFDRAFPIDFDFQVQDLPTGTMALATYLNAVSKGTPFLIRSEDVPEDITITAHNSIDRLSNVMADVMSVLPKTWQCTVLFGRVILYPRHQEYKFNQKVLYGAL